MLALVLSLFLVLWPSLLHWILISLIVLCHFPHNIKNEKKSVQYLQAQEKSMYRGHSWSGNREMRASQGLHICAIQFHWFCPCQLQASSWISSWIHQRTAFQAKWNSPKILGMGFIWRWATSNSLWHVFWACFRIKIWHQGLKLIFLAKFY